MDETKTPIANPALLEAVARMNTEASRESREVVLDLVIFSTQFLAPVSVTPPPATNTDGQPSLGQDTAIQFQLLSNQEGQLFFPVFTSWEELRKLCGPKNQQTLVITFDDIARMILRDNQAAGFVVDPFGVRLSFDRAMVEHLVSRKNQ